MIVIILRLILLTINTLTNLISGVILTAIAQLMVLLIQAIQVPGQAAHGVIQQITEFIKACFGTVLQLIMDAISSLISSGFDLLIEAITESLSFTGSSVWSLMEKTTTSIGDLVKDFPELAREISDMVSTLVTDLWSNYMDAFGYVTENV